MKSTSIVILFFLGLVPALYAQQVRIDVIPGTPVQFEMVLVPGGAFEMGPSAETVLVRVDSFWMGRFEVSYDEFAVFYHRDLDSDTTLHPTRAYRVDAVTRPTPQYMDYTYGMGRNGYPAVSMTQQAALRYCQWLYEKTGRFYRLATEAEWEYACKLGRTDTPPSGNMLDCAWLADNANHTYHPVGTRQPNALGIFDMLGNVAEWTLDDYRPDYLDLLRKGETDNPWMVPIKKHSRTVRGGSYKTKASECACTERERSDPRWQARDPQIPKSKWWNPDSPFVGFRIVNPVKQPSEQEVFTFFQTAIKD